MKNSRANFGSVLRAGAMLLLVAAALNEARAANSVLTPERTLRIEFSTTPPFIESLPNTLYAVLGHIDRIEPFERITGSLYDGDQLLGTSTSLLGGDGVGAYAFFPAPVTWKTPESPWDHPAGSPASVNFNSLHDGTINGRIDIVIESGRFALDLAAVRLRFVHATYSNGGSSIPPAPVIRSIRIVPELPGDPDPPVVPPEDPRNPFVYDDDDDYVMSTAAFRQACELAQGTAIVFNRSVKISNGNPATEQIPLDCTLVLGLGVSLEFDQVSLVFAGRLAIQSSHPAEIKLDKSTLKAPAITVTTAGSSNIALNDSTLEAEHGDVQIVLTSDAKIQSTGSRLAASAAVQLWVGSGSEASFTSSRVEAAGFKCELGEASLFKGVESQFTMPNEILQWTGSGADIVFELQASELKAGTGTYIQLEGENSLIKLDRVSIEPLYTVARGALANPVSIVAGAINSSTILLGSGYVPGSDNGRIEASHLTILSEAGIWLSSSIQGTGGGDQAGRKLFAYAHAEWHFGGLRPFRQNRGEGELLRIFRANLDWHRPGGELRQRIQPVLGQGQGLPLHDQESS